MQLEAIEDLNRQLDDLDPVMEQMEADVADMEAGTDSMLIALMIVGFGAAAALFVYYVVLKRWPIQCATCGENLQPGARYRWKQRDRVKVLCAKCNARLCAKMGQDPVDELLDGDRPQRIR